jgi:hypothetical protein
MDGGHSSCRQHCRQDCAECLCFSLDNPFWDTCHYHFWLLAAIYFSTAGCAMQDAWHLASADHNLPSRG